MEADKAKQIAELVKKIDVVDNRLNRLKDIIDQGNNVSIEQVNLDLYDFPHSVYSELRTIPISSDLKFGQLVVNFMYHISNEEKKELLAVLKNL